MRLKYHDYPDGMVVYTDDHKRSIFVTPRYCKICYIELEGDERFVSSIGDKISHKEAFEYVRSNDED